MAGTTRTVSVPVRDHAPVDVVLNEHGDGRPILLLHGGAGAQSVTGFGQALVERGPARVLTPTHPGFNGTARPAWLDSIRGLADIYRRLLDQLDLTDVTVVGFSIGGWLAAELALTGTVRLSGLVLTDAVGIQVDGHPVADIFPLPPEQLAALSYHDPEPFRIDPASLSDEQRTILADNRATLATYGGGPAMADPMLRDRLAAISLPTLVIWGDSDGIVDPDYGRAYAAAIPGARFELLADTGHLPQIERPEPLLQLIGAFTATAAARG